MTAAKEVLEHIEQKELQSAMASIKPCPFCGREVKLIQNTVSCMCGARMPNTEAKAAIAAWNRRVKDDESGKTARNGL